MSSLYKNKNIYYLSLYHNGKRVTKSLKSSEYKVAKALKPLMEASIIQELTGIKERNAELSFSLAISLKKKQGDYKSVTPAFMI